MNIINCKNCGRICNHLVGPLLCERCKEELNELFAEVKEFIYENPGCGINDVAGKFSISIWQIKQWIKEERLEFTSNSIINLTCERCGDTIRTGRFCIKCKNNLAQQFNGVYSENKPVKPIEKTGKTDARMRFIKKD